MVRFVFLLVLVNLAVRAWCEEVPSSAVETLTVENAVALALRDNRMVKNAAQEVQKAEDDVAISRTRRLPVFDFTFFGSQLLTPVEFEFERGVFGTFPSTGPIPGSDTPITTPRRPNELILASASQPLSQLYKIGLGVRMNQLNIDIAREQLRLQKQSVVNDVKQLYYKILQSQSALEVSEETLKLYRELDREVEDQLAQQTALKADSLDVKARLAKTEYDALVLRNAYATQKEQLNGLLGRDIRSDFKLSSVPEAAELESDLKAAQTRALQQRPEINEARLKLRQSNFDQRLKKSEFIPDVSLRLSYISPFGVTVLPKNVASAGLYIQWEPFDWGRRKLELSQKVKTTQQARLGLSETETQILIEVNAKFRKLAESRLLLRASHFAQQAAQEKLRLANNNFQQHTVELKEVLQAQTSFAQANDQYQRSLLEFWNAKADFEKALGED